MGATGDDGRPAGMPGPALADSHLRVRPAGWPKGTRTEKLAEPDICVAMFPDLGGLNARLRDRMLAAGEDEAFRRRLDPVFGGLKIDGLARWGGNDFEVLTRRAAELACSVFGWPGAQIVRCWGNLYRSGDSSLAHSHTGCSASVVYFLDNGDEDAKAPLSGRLVICDPRIEECQAGEPGALLKPIILNAKPGMMILIPYHIVHAVTPYRGTRPRLTIAWDIKRPGASVDPSAIMLRG